MFGTPRLDPTAARQEKGRAVLTKLQQVAPQAVETLAAQGVSAIMVAHDGYKQSIGFFEQALQLAPNDDGLRSLLGQSYRRVGLWDQAVQSYAHALRLNPLLEGYESDQTFVGYQSTLMETRRYQDVVAVTHRQNALTPSLQTQCRIVRVAVLAQYELDGDLNRLLEGLHNLPQDAENPHNVVGRYTAALFQGKLDEAAQIVSDPQLGPTQLFRLDSTSFNLAGIERAMLFRLAGKREAAAREAAAVRPFLQRPTWTGALKFYAQGQLVRALAYSGEEEAAVRLADALRRELDNENNRSSERLELNRIGRVYAMLGRKEEALAILRTLMTGPGCGGFGCTPRTARLDPCWSLLADDPRFDEILRNARPL
jgi:tetratricopeptide (TPR) repeat protein